jgi:hypothetical protein
MARKTQVTPPGVAIWPYLTQPDTKFNEDGEFRVKLELAYKDDGVEDLIAEIDAQMKQSLEESEANKAADPPYKENEASDGVVVSFKSKAKGTRKDGSTWEYRPALFDAAGKPIKSSEVKIGNGSILKVSFTPNRWNTPMLGAGVTLRIQGAQIIKLEEYGGRAEDHGFGAEDGYVHEQDPWTEDVETVS